MEYMESQMQSRFDVAEDTLRNTPVFPTTPEEFTKHVGAESFAEAVSVTLRTKASDEDTKEWQHNKIKDLAKQFAEAKAWNKFTEIEINNLRELYDSVTAERELLMADAVTLRKALEGVVRVADRKTDEFDAAHAALAAEHLGAPLMEAVGKAVEALKYIQSRNDCGYAVRSNATEALALLAPFAPKVDQSTESAS